jgi:3-methyladenine DNA glycosylase/8-oxoguanine DNA glycosylase
VRAETVEVGFGIGCDDVAEELSAVSDASVLSVNARRHVETCLRCQADLVQYRRLLRALRSLRTEVLEPAPGLLPEILASIEHAGERRAIRAALNGRRAAYIGGIAAATAAGAAGAIVLATRNRRYKMVS